MNEVATDYNVVFQADPDEDGNVSLAVLYASDPASIKLIVSALSAFYSGDPCQCWINGEEAVLDKDWGLAEPPVQCKDNDNG